MRSRDARPAFSRFSTQHSAVTPSKSPAPDVSQHEPHEVSTYDVEELQQRHQANPSSHRKNSVFFDKRFGNNKLDESDFHRSNQLLDSFMGLHPEKRREIILSLKEGFRQNNSLPDASSLRQIIEQPA